MKRIIFGILIIIWMICVFMLSNENGEESKGTSDEITTRIVDKTITKENEKIKEEVEKQSQNTNKTQEQINKEIEKKQKKEYNNKKEETSYIVRKAAHFTLYFIGGILIFNFISTFGISKTKIILISILLACMYAISDEIHQYFVSARSSEIKDVLIDTAGATVRNTIL